MRNEGPWELYDMAEDRTEQHDLASEHPSVVNELAAAWEAWAVRANVGAWTGPEINDAGDALEE